MVKDPSGTILPPYGIYFTRKEAIRYVEMRNPIFAWIYWKRKGWKIVKVKITEDAPERTDNK